jgi:hypothetical protein
MTKTIVTSLQNSSRIIIVLGFSNQEHLNKHTNYIQFLTDNNIFTNVDCHEFILTNCNNDYTNKETCNQILQVYEEFYNKGYRFAIGIEPSEIVLNVMIPFLSTHSDFLYFNTNSTIDFTLNIPNYINPLNLVRTSYNDTFLTNYILKTFLNNIVNVLTSTNKSLFTTIFNNKLKTSKQKYYFQKIVYIYYGCSSYTSSYLKSLKTNIKKYDSSNVTLEVYDITSVTADNFPSELVNLLTSNPVSRCDDFQKNDKTLFILNSSFPQEMLDLFQDKKFYDNIFVFSDTFSKTQCYSRHIFQYGFIPIGTFSFNGYKLCKFVDPVKSMSPCVLAIYDILTYTYNIYQSYFDNLSDFLQKLNDLQYLSNNVWFERKIVVFHTNFNYRNYIKNVTKNPLERSICFYLYGFNDLSTGIILGPGPSDFLNRDSQDSDAITQYQYLGYQLNFLRYENHDYHIFDAGFNSNYLLDTNYILNKIGYINFGSTDDYNSNDQGDPITIWTEALTNLDTTKKYTPGIWAIYYSFLRLNDNTPKNYNVSVNLIAYFSTNGNFTVYSSKHVNADTGNDFISKIAFISQGNGNIGLSNDNNDNSELSDNNFYINGSTLTFKGRYSYINQYNQVDYDSIYANVQLIPSTPNDNDSENSIKLVFFNKGDFIQSDNIIYSNTPQRLPITLTITYTTFILYVPFKINDVIQVMNANNPYPNNGLNYDNYYAIIKNYFFNARNELQLLVEYLNFHDNSDTFTRSGVIDIVNIETNDTTAGSATTNNNVYFPNSNSSFIITA